SSYMRDLFVPFVDSGVAHPLSNPWQLWPARHFPYGSVLYLVLLVPKWLGTVLFGEAASGQTPLSIALMKLPLLLFDLVLLATLQKLAPQRERKLELFYWLNPIVLYITYVHAQLDVVSMALACLALWLLLGQRLVLSGLAMGAAISCKFHIAVLVPFVLIY